MLEWLRNRIKEIKEELNNLEGIYSLLKEGKGMKEVRKGIPRTTVKVIASDGDILANVVESKEGLRIIFTEGLPKDDPYVKSFLLKVLEDKRSSGSVSNYEVVEKKGYVTEIKFPEGVSDKLLKELELVIKYVWSNLSSE